MTSCIAIVGEERAGSHDEMFLIVRPPKGLSLLLFSIVQNPFHGLYPMAREEESIDVLVSLCLSLLS